MVNWLKKMLFEEVQDVEEENTQNPTVPEQQERVFIDIVTPELFADLEEEEFKVAQPTTTPKPDYWLSAVISPIYGEVTTPIKVMNEVPPTTVSIPQEKAGYLGTIISPMYGNAKQDIKPITSVAANPEVDNRLPDFQTPANVNQPDPVVSNQPPVTELPSAFVNQPQPVMPQAQASVDPLPQTNIVPTNDYDQYLEIKKILPENEEEKTIVLTPQPPAVLDEGFLPPESEPVDVGPISEVEVSDIETKVEKKPVAPLKRSKPKAETPVSNDSLFDEFEDNFTTTELSTLPDDFGTSEEVKFNKLDLFDGD